MKIWQKIIHGILPAMLLSSSVGQIYAFTNFAADAAARVGCLLSTIQWAFSLGIFFLGMGAAFFGPLAERDIKKSSLLGMLSFILGMVAAQIGLIMQSAALVLVGYGFLVGLGTGVVYITPVKTLMMWFPERKGLASAVPIIFFGLGSTFATWIYSALAHFNLQGQVFSALAVIYTVTMALGALLLKKPEGWSKAEATGSAGFSYAKLLRTPFFIRSWLFMLINISAGLCIIPLAKTFMASDLVKYTAAVATALVALAGVFNGGGRLVFAWSADKLKWRTEILLWISAVSALSVVSCTMWPMLFGGTMLLLNACYGAGFSVIPGILSDRFGMTDISKIHGAVLSAWGVAGLIGNQIALAITSAWGLRALLIAIICFHLINLIFICFMMDREMKKYKLQQLVNAGLQ